MYARKVPFTQNPKVVTGFGLVYGDQVLGLRRLRRAPTPPAGFRELRNEHRFGAIRETQEGAPAIEVCTRCSTLPPPRSLYISFEYRCSISTSNPI